MNKWLTHCREKQANIFERIDKYYTILRDIKTKLEEEQALIQKFTKELSEFQKLYENFEQNEESMILSLFLEAHEFYKSYIEKQELTDTPDHYTKITKWIDHFSGLSDSIFKLKQNCVYTT